MTLYWCFSVVLKEPHPKIIEMFDYLSANALGADPLEHANILYKPIGCTH